MGTTFFIDFAGDDAYLVEADPLKPPDDRAFGLVHDARWDLVRVGVFMDLGGGRDIYRTARAAVRNDSSWSTRATSVEPGGFGVHGSIGLDE